MRNKSLLVLCFMYSYILNTVFFLTITVKLFDFFSYGINLHIS